MTDVLNNEPRKGISKCHRRRKSVAAGGVEQETKYGGKVDYFLKYDGTKSSYWNGFSASMHTETRYGEDVNAIDGMLSFGNFNMAFPKAGEDVTAITAVSLTLSLTDNFRVYAAKFNSLDDFELNFTGHNGIDRFMNSAAVANIINARTVPYSTYGVGFTVFQENEPLFIFVVRDPDDHATTLDLDELFANGVLLSGTLKIISEARWSARTPEFWVQLEQPRLHLRRSSFIRKCSRSRHRRSPGVWLLGVVVQLRPIPVGQPIRPGRWLGRIWNDRHFRRKPESN